MEGKTDAIRAVKNGPDGIGESGGFLRIYHINGGSKNAALANESARTAKP